MLSDCRSLSYARRMKDTSSILFHDACFLSSFSNLSHGFVPGSYVRVTDAITRQFVDSEIIEDFPVKALQQMPAIKYDKPALFTAKMVNEIIWTNLHSGDLIDCTLKKTILSNPPIDLEDCLLQLLQCSPPEEFLNLLLNGIIDPNHTNWISANHKKFTQIEYAQLLSKCEQPRVLGEIARILKLDDLSTKVPHFVTAMNMSAHKTDLAQLCSKKASLPRHLVNSSENSLAYSSVNSLAINSVNDLAHETASQLHIDPEYQIYCRENSPLNLTAYPSMENTYPVYCEITNNATKLTTSQDLPPNHRFLVDSFRPDEIQKVMNLLQSNSSLLPPSLLPALKAHDFDSLVQYLLSAISTEQKQLFMPFHLPENTHFKLHVSRDPLTVQLRSTKEIHVDPMSHLNIDLNLQMLSRSTHLAMHPQYKGGDIFLASLYSTSVTAKHQFETVFLFNCTMCFTP